MRIYTKNCRICATTRQFLYGGNRYLCNTRGVTAARRQYSRVPKMVVPMRTIVEPSATAMR